MLKYKEVNNSNIMSKNSIVCSHCNMINPIIKKVLINKELIDSKKSDDYDYSNVASLHDSDGNTYSVYAKRYLGTTTSSQYKCSYKIRCLDCKRDIKYIIYKWE